MKLEISNGNLLIKNASDEVTQFCRGDFKSVYVDTLNTDFLYISELVDNSPYNANNPAIKIDITEVTHLNGAAFSGTVQDIVTALDVAPITSINADYIDVDADGDYQSLQDWNNPLSILIIKTTTTGTAVNRLFYKETVADLAAYNTLWAARASKTYVNPISL